MAGEFVPFLVARPAPPSRPAGAGPGGFAALPVPPAPAQIIPDAASPSAPTPPTVTLKRDGDRVTQIQIRCACGEVIELDCVY